MLTMHRIIAISLSVLLVMAFCPWSTIKAYHIRPSNSQYHSQKGQTVSSSSSKNIRNGHYRKYNPDYDDWLFYVQDFNEKDLPLRRERRGFYEALSNFTRTSVYNLFNWGKSSTISTSTRNCNKKNDNINVKNVTPRVDNEVQEPPLPIPRVRFQKVVKNITESNKKQIKKCTSSTLNCHINFNDVDRPFIFTDAFLSTHHTEDSLLPFFSHDPSKPDGPDHWNDAAPACGGNFQSPIALNDRDVVITKRQIKINGLESLPTSIKLQNDGHSVKYLPEYGSEGRPTISGGPLPGEYVLHHFHFHWGSTNDRGSEHTLNGKQYASEIHLVHYNTKYRSFDEAAAAPQGLAVLGFLYQINEQLHDDFLATGLDKVINWNDTTVLNEEDTYSIEDIIGDTPFEFISYAGSLTTPPCYETVTWLVATEPLSLSEEEITAFRQLKDSSGSQMVDNYRPLQRRNGRKLFLFPEE